MKFIINNTGIVFFHAGKPLKINKDSIQYTQIIKCFDLPENEQSEAIGKILDNSAKPNCQGFSFENDEVFYLGEKIPSPLSDKILSIFKEGLPISLFVEFWKNLRLNPSASSVRELYEFLAYKELPITEDGCFLAYKGIDQDYWSITGNKNTVVLKGQVNSLGKILNTVGSEIEVARRDVDDNREITCSFGLHVGSLEYASDFSRGKVVVVKVNPKDVVSVPTDCDKQKCRVSRYEVISILETEIKAPVTDAQGLPMEPEDKKERNYFIDRVEKYLLNKAKRGWSLVSIQEIQNCFSPEYPSKVRVLEALKTLGYSWTTQRNKEFVVLP